MSVTTYHSGDLSQATHEARSANERAVDALVAWFNRPEDLEQAVALELFGVSVKAFEQLQVAVHRLGEVKALYIRRRAELGIDQ